MELREPGCVMLRERFKFITTRLIDTNAHSRGGQVGISVEVIVMMMERSDLVILSSKLDN